MGDLFESTNTRYGRHTLSQNDNYFSHNTAFGVSALMENNSGICNTACGTLALATNTGGCWNTSLGTSTLYNSFGNGNVACGTSSLERNLSGSYNVGLGLKSLYDNTTGINNVGVGVLSGEGNVEGNNNTYIGNYSSTSGNFSCSTAIGFKSKITANHQIVLGTVEDTIHIPGTLSLSTQKVRTKKMVIDESIQASSMEIFSSPQNQDILCTLKSTNEYHLDPIGYGNSFDKLSPFLYINKKIGNIDIGLNVNKVADLYPMLVNDKNINYIGLIGILVNELQWVKSQLKALKDEVHQKEIIYKTNLTHKEEPVVQKEESLVQKEEPVVEQEEIVEQEQEEEQEEENQVVEEQVVEQEEQEEVIELMEEIIVHIEGNIPKEENEEEKKEEEDNNIDRDIVFF